MQYKQQKTGRGAVTLRLYGIELSALFGVPSVYCGGIGRPVGIHPKARARSVSFAEEEIDEFLSGRWVARLATLSAVAGHLRGGHCVADISPQVSRCGGAASSASQQAATEELRKKQACLKPASQGTGHVESCMVLNAGCGSSKPSGRSTVPEPCATRWPASLSPR
jgi:hypothetical protein